MTSFDHLPIHDVVLVEVHEGENELRDVEPGTLLRESRLLLEMPEQLAAALEVRHEVQVGLRLE